MLIMNTAKMLVTCDITLINHLCSATVIIVIWLIWQNGLTTNFTLKYGAIVPIFCIFHHHEKAENFSQKNLC